MPLLLEWFVEYSGGKKRKRSRERDGTERRAPTSGGKSPSLGIELMITTEGREEKKLDADVSLSLCAS